MGPSLCRCAADLRHNLRPTPLTSGVHRFWSALVVSALIACQSPAPVVSPSQSVQGVAVSPTPDRPSPSPTLLLAPPVSSCAPKEFTRLPPPASDPVSPVQARVVLEGDGGVASPIYVSLWRFPATLTVLFDQPVDPTSFALRVVPYDGCGYGTPTIDQVTRWVSDREARVTVRPPFPLSNYAIAFGRGRDRQGREVQEPQFQFLPSPLTRGGRIGTFDIASGQAIWARDLEPDLSPVSISPDGRYALLTREIHAAVNGHSRTRIPYVLDISSGMLTPYPRQEVWDIRWDLERSAVWISGTTYLEIALPGSIVDFADRLPPTSRLVADALVSPDRRWLAVLLGPAEGIPAEGIQLAGNAELVLVDLDTGRTTSRGEPLRFGRSPGGSFPEVLSWSPDSSSLLITSHLSFDDVGGGFAFSAEYYTASVPELKLGRIPGIGEMKGRGFVQWSPDGRHVVLQEVGIFRADGSVAFRETGFAPAMLWSKNGRFALIGKRDAYAFELLDVVSGSRQPIRLTIDPGRPVYILGIADDGSRVYLGDPYAR
jgi:hypothetical protein